MPTSKSYTASIVVNGQPLTEYNPPVDEHDDDPRKCIRYIEALEASQFSVHLDLKPQTKFTSPTKIIWIYIDGKLVAGSVVTKERVYRSLHHEYTGRLLEEKGELVEQAFLFTKMVTTEETPKEQELKRIAKEIGTIRVKVYNGTAGKLSPFSGYQREESSKIVPEKALKGRPIDMAAGYGEAKLVQARPKCDSRSIGKAEAFFEFKYRSKRALQLLDLIPATPEPQALEERELNTLNLDEARLLLSQYRQRESPARALRSRGIKMENLEVKAEDGSTEDKGRKRRAPFVDDDEVQILDVKRCKPISIDEVDVLDLS